MAVKRWNGTTWDVYAGADTSPGFAATDGRSGRRTYVGANTPTAPVDGDIWIDQDTATNAIPASAFDAKGDLMVGTGPDTYTRQAVGTDGQVLVADSSQADGVLWSHTPSRQGLVNIVPTSVAVGSGSASVSANGAVTIGNVVSSVTVNGAFSSAYDNYIIQVIGGAGSTTTNCALTLGSTSTGYYSAGLYLVYTSTTITGFNSNNGAAFSNAVAVSTTNLLGEFSLYAPNLAKTTGFRSFLSEPHTGGASLMRSGFLNDTTQYTAFTLTPASGTLTGGTIRVYGYGNGA